MAFRVAVVWPTGEAGSVFAEGLVSSSRIVTVDPPEPIVALTGAESATVNDSLPSSRSSPRTLTVNVSVVSPGANVRSQG